MQEILPQSTASSLWSIACWYYNHARPKQSSAVLLEVQAISKA
jgi:hypothetical protein